MHACTGNCVHVLLSSPLLLLLLVRRPGQPGAGRYLGACRRACMCLKLHRKTIDLVRVRQQAMQAYMCADGAHASTHESTQEVNSRMYTWLYSSTFSRIYL
jgi:hypothetical protein